MTIRRSDDILSSPIDDTLMMMSISRARYFGLNGVATRIWALLEQPTTPDAIVATLLDEYDVTPELCEAHVAEFLAALRERHLLLEQS